MKAKYVHTNIIAENWNNLADFYTRVFGCVCVPPERDYTGEALDAGTGLVNAHLRGAHLRLPGIGFENTVFATCLKQQALPQILQR